MQKLVIFAIVGVVAQLIDGALGMAYGVTATTLLLSTGSSAAVASASVHLAEVGTTFVSGLSHWRFRNVNWRTVAWIGLPGGVGAFLGAGALSSLPAGPVKPVVAVILFCLGGYVILRFAFGTMLRPVPDQHLKGRFLGPLGFFAGFLDAVGGGGWGPVTTPTLMTAGRMEPRKAVGSASASEFIVSVCASAGFLLSLGRAGVDAQLAGALLAGGVCAAPLAAWLVQRLHPRLMGTMVGGIILITNTRTLLIAAGAPGPVRLACLVGLAGVCASITVRTSRSLPAKGLAPPDWDAVAAVDDDSAGASAHPIPTLEAGLYQDPMAQAEGTGS